MEISVRRRTTPGAREKTPGSIKHRLVGPMLWLIPGQLTCGDTRCCAAGLACRGFERPGCSGEKAVEATGMNYGVPVAVRLKRWQVYRPRNVGSGEEPSTAYSHEVVRGKGEMRPTEGTNVPWPHAKASLRAQLCPPTRKALPSLSHAPALSQDPATSCSSVAGSKSGFV